MFAFLRGGGGSDTNSVPLFPLRTVLFPGGLLSPAQWLVLDRVAGTFANGSKNVTVVVINGVATFDSLVINTPGTKYTLQASAGLLTKTISSVFAIT